MECKYKIDETAEAKRDFELFRNDDNGELAGVLVVPQGTKGIIQSMGCNSTDNFKNHYDILLTSEINEIETTIFEDDITLYFKVV